MNALIASSNEIAALAEMGWREAALKQYEKAYELDQKNPDSAFNLALIYLTMYSDAMKDASKDHENRGIIRAQANKYKRAAKEWYDCAKSCGAAADPELERLLK